MEILEFKRFDGGHPDYQNTLINQDSIYISTDGGIFKFSITDFEEYYNNSTSIIRPNIASLSNGLNTLQAVHVAYQESSDQLAMGFWHNGSFLKSSTNNYLYKWWRWLLFSISSK